MKRLFWLSFADPDRPEGDQFLGVIVTGGADFLGAVIQSHVMGINPGGEVAGAEIPVDLESLIEPGERDRLIPASEALALSERIDRAAADTHQ